MNSARYVDGDAVLSDLGDSFIGAVDGTRGDRRDFRQRRPEDSAGSSA